MQISEPLEGIDIITGCMFSSKTTELLNRLNVYKEMTLKVLYVNSTIDTRSENSLPAVFSTHNPVITSAGKIDTLKTTNLIDVYTVLLTYDVIGIDEAGFYTDLKEVVLNLAEKEGKKVIVAGLNSDFMRKPFGQLNDLIPFCDSITKLTSYCQTCRDNKILRRAHFSKRITKNEETVLVGAQDSYIPVCRKCYNNK